MRYSSRVLVDTLSVPLASTSSSFRHRSFRQAGESAIRNLRRREEE
jgi:hypothetical protein